MGVGLLHGEGYFQQYLNEDGWQQEVYTENDFHTMQLRLDQHRDGTPLLIEVAFPESRVQTQVWRAQGGRSSEKVSGPANSIEGGTLWS